MNLSTILREFWRMLRDHILIVVLSSLLIGGLSVFFRYQITNYRLSEIKEPINHLIQVYQQQPATFKAIVLVEDGQLFNNAYAYDELFSTPTVVSQIESLTQVDIARTLDSERQVELYKNYAFRGGVAALRDSASGVFTFRFLVGKTAEENLAVANAYYDLLQNQPDILDAGQRVTLLSEPEILELDNIDELSIVPTIETLNIYRSTRAKPLILYGVLGVLLGAILAFGVMLLKRLFSEKIQYAFEYSWELSDRHELLSWRDFDHARQVESFQYPRVTQRWIFDQIGNLFETDSFSSESHYLTDFGQLIQLADAPDEIMIIIQAGQTDKAWYRRVRELTERYHCPIRILQLNP